MAAVDERRIYEGTRVPSPVPTALRGPEGPEDVLTVNFGPNHPSTHGVLRLLVDLHGEDESARPYTDALCIALQILNHLQDCKDDYLNLDRVYIPCDMLSEAGTGVEALAADRSSPQLRTALSRVLARTDELILKARLGPMRRP